MSGASKGPKLAPGGSQRTVRACIVTKDQRGYGLTVHGTRPVMVQSVRAEGAAWKAGIRELDEILEVNGVSVEGMSHGDVVKLIKEKPCVEFKVTAGSGHRKNGAAGRQRTTISSTSQTTITYNKEETRSVDPAQFRDISTIPAEAVKHLKGIDKLQEAPTSESSGDTQVVRVVRASVTSPRPWVALSQSQGPAPLLAEPADDDGQFPLTHTKSCSMPEQASASLVTPKPARSKSDSQKRRPVSMDVSHLETSGANAAPTTNSNSNSSLNAKHSKSFLNVNFLHKHPSFRSVTNFLSPPSSLRRWMSQPRVDEPASVPAEEDTAATIGPPNPVTAGVDPDGRSSPVGGSSHRRTNSSDIFELDMKSSGSLHSLTPGPACDAPVYISDDEMDDPEGSSQHAKISVQKEMFSDLARVFQRSDVTVTLVLFGHRQSSLDDRVTDYHRLLCLIVMLDYKRCLTQRESRDSFMKDHRRLAYEIFSTFFAEDSPLDVKLPASLAAEVGEPLRREEEESPQTLRSLLLRAEEQTANDLNLLTSFRNLMELGLENQYTDANYDFVGSRKPQQRSYFERKINFVIEETTAATPGESPRKSALLAALQTVIKYFQCADEKPPFRSMENLSSVVMPFNTKMSKSKSMIPNFNKKRTTYHAHSLAVKSIETYHLCDFCGKIISGTAPQADVCHNCTAVVHRECRDKWQRPCDRSKRSSSIFGQFTKSDRKVKEMPPPTIHESKKRQASREGSAEFAPSATSPGVDGRPLRNNSFRGVKGTVSSIVNKFEAPTYDAESMDSAIGSSLPEEGLGRSESLKSERRFNTPPWRHKSDSSQHADAINEAESLSLAAPHSASGGGSHDSVMERSPSTLAPEFDNERLENDVRRALEQEPLIRNLPADVQDYFQEFGFRAYYERLSRDGSRKGKNYLKDYQSACCEIYFQELSHIRNLKVMQLMFVEQWPAGAEDLRVAMGLDKLLALIELRCSLVEELARTRCEENGMKFVNMGQGYLNWLTPQRSALLKRLLGSIRYKGENYYDKLLQERYKKVGHVVERTFNKLNLFDIMISVNQHACRPSLLMTPVKKSLGKLAKADEHRYHAELEVWKKAEGQLTDVAHYLDQLKRRVVDVIPKIDASKVKELHVSYDEAKVPEYKDLPRCLNTFLFLRDADCQVRMEQDGKVRDTRLLFFADFLVLLYQDNKDAPERFVMRPWDSVMPILPIASILHVACDRTSKSAHTLLLAIAVENRESVSNSSQTTDRADRARILYVTFKDSKDMESIQKELKQRVEAKPKLASARGTSLGSTASMNERGSARPRRSGSNVSTQSAMPSLGQNGPRTTLKEPTPNFSGEKDSFPETLDRQDSGETSQTLRQTSSGSTQSLETADLKATKSSQSVQELQSALSSVRRSLMLRQGISERRQFEQMADLLETEGAKDASELQIVLISHLTALADQLGRLCAAAETEETSITDFQAASELLMASHRFQGCLQRYARASDSLRHSVFEEPLSESQSAAYHTAPKISSDDDIEEEEGDEEEHTEKEEEEEEKERKEDDDVEEKREEDVVKEEETEEKAVEASDEDETTTIEENAFPFREMARQIVQNALAGALETCRAQQEEEEGEKSAPQSPAALPESPEP